VAVAASSAVSVVIESSAISEIAIPSLNFIGWVLLCCSGGNRPYGETF
jgi:hypothetical protein